MPIVTIVQAPRDIAEKRRLVSGITRVFAEVGAVPADKVHIVFQDADGEHYAVTGKLVADR
uniref:4-oxalocrotonate tatuomerase n=1 Tax=Streptoalloteichus sp. ATCC 53650 TaxID=756733 RepID=K4NYQ7_9PSEU|nr:4-oxalocrotonate tatuomerase [Streptoalloteichus sp. ATCC 53650]